MPIHRVLKLSGLVCASVLLVPAACAQTPSPPPSQSAGQSNGQTPEQPKGDLAEAAQAAVLARDVNEAADAELEALLANLDAADLATTALRTRLWHYSENFVTGLTQIREGTLTLQTERPDAADENAEPEPPIRRFRVDFEKLILDNRESDVNTAYIFDGAWLAERLEDEKQFNKWQLVRPGERFDPNEKMEGSAIWLPIGQDTDRLRATYRTALVAENDYFEDEVMPGMLAGVVAHGGGAQQLRLIPRDEDNAVTEIRMWFDAETHRPRAHAVLDGEGVQIALLFNVEANPNDIDPVLFDTSLPPIAEGWDASVRPWREGAEP